MLRFGPANGPLLIAALPLFEEANRTRAFTVTVLRALAERGIASALPDLPGQGESAMPTHETTLALMREAFAAAAGSAASAFSLAIRSGTLLDSAANLAGRYHFSPMSGADLRRELVRARQASARESGEPFDATVIGAASGPIELAGNLISPALLNELADAVPAAHAHVVRLETDAKGADAKLPGTPLWRRAEPDNDADLAARIADDICAWVARCVA